MNLSDTIIQTLKALSRSDLGTLYHRCTLLSRRNVVKAPKKSNDVCSAFLDNVSNAHLLVCGMAYIGLSGKDDKFVPTAAKCGP